MPNRAHTMGGKTPVRQVGITTGTTNHMASRPMHFSHNTPPITVTMIQTVRVEVGIMVIICERIIKRGTIM
jgi:hypothetical protein